MIVEEIESQILENISKTAFLNPNRTIKKIFSNTYAKIKHLEIGKSIKDRISLSILIKNIYIIIFFVSLLQTACKDVREFKKVRIKPIQNDKVYNTNKKNDLIKIAIAPVISPTSSFFVYNDFIEYLKRKSDLDIVTVFKKTYSEINQLLKINECDIAFICTGAYIKAKQDFPLEILAIPVVNNKTTYNSYIIVSKDSNINNFNELKGKSFAFTDLLSLSGYYYPKYRLCKIKTLPDKFFSKIIFTSSHDNSIKAVAQKMVDAAAVDSIVYETLLKQNNFYARELKVIEKSQPFGIPPVVMRKGLKEDKKKKLLNILLNMHRDLEGSKILKKLSIDRFIYPSDEIYSYTEKMIKECELENE